MLQILLVAFLKNSFQRFFIVSIRKCRTKLLKIYQPQNHIWPNLTPKSLRKHSSDRRTQQPFETKDNECELSRKEVENPRKKCHETNSW